LLVLVGFTSSGSSLATSDGVIHLKYADQNSAFGWEATRAAQPWLDQIQAATNGKVQIQPYYSETLTKGANARDAVKRNLTDIAWMFHGYWAGQTPLSNVISLPFLPFTSAKQASGILWQLYEKYPAMRAELQDNHVLLMWASAPYFLLTSKGPVKTLEDFNNLKIRVTNGPPVEMMQALGAIPVTVGMPDTYLYLKKGVIDATACAWENIVSWRLYEVAKYYTYVPLFTVYFSQVMNTDKWNSLPVEVQEQINSVSGLSGSLFWGENMFDTSAAAGQQLIKQEYYQMFEYTLPSELQNMMMQIAGKPIWESWVKKMTDAGHPEAQEMLDTTLELIRTYKL
jgi:TRAP-type C4-dicarboxylate transport system substrate-binding protein